MSKYVYWFREIVDLSEPWVQQVDYGKLLVAGFPLPSGFVISPDVRQEIQNKLCVEDISKISPSSIPEDLKKEITDYFFKLNLNYDPGSIPTDAQSFIGMNKENNLALVKSGSKMYLNVRGTGELLDAVLKCLALGSGPVIIQKMISPEKAGTFITSKDGDIYIEATYGFATPIIRGDVEPDAYTISKHSGDIKNKKVGSKQFALVTNQYNRTLEQVYNDGVQQRSYVLSDRELEVISKLAKMLETYANKPQKAVWAISGRRVYLMEILNYVEEPTFEKKEEPKEDDWMSNLSQSQDTSPPVDPPMDLPQEPEPAKDDFFSSEFSSSMNFFDAPKEEPKMNFAPPAQEPMNFAPKEPFAPMIQENYSPTRSKFGIIVSNPSLVNNLLAQNPDLFMIKLEDVFPYAGIHPSQINSIGPLSYSDKLSQALSSVVSMLRGKDVLISLSDLRSDKFGAFERNPLLGQRGVRKLNSQLLDLEFSALSKTAMYGHTFKLVLPFVTSISELRNVQDNLYKYNLAGVIKIGAVIETPASVSIVDQICEQVNFVLINVDTLTELILAIDRSNESISHMYDFKHDAVKNAISGVIKICKSKNIPVYIEGDALQDAEFVRFLKEKGVDNIITTSDNFNKVKADFSSYV